MSAYLVIKALHIISSCILFGTGIGIAFFMLRSHYTDDLSQKHYAARNTVLADSVFTLPAVIVQPLSGGWLIYHSCYAWNTPWLLASYALFIGIGCCWLPVVWIQLRLSALIKHSLASNTPLPNEYHRLFKLWCILGVPAFVGIIIVFFLMVSKPSL